MLDLDRALAQFPVLETERLLLRQPVLADRDPMFAIMADPQVLRYFGQLPMETPEQAENRLNSLKRSFEQKIGVRWAITLHEHGEWIGSAGFWRFESEHARAEIGYELAAHSWGKGIMTEALQAILQFGFETLKLHSIEAQIHPDNQGSRRALEKVGFHQEGLLRENYFDIVENRFTDTVVFGLLGADWRAAQAKKINNG
ncbi:GNAT family N-acetyltransferase [Herpetosiphon llansteffanensis]|uniref:GNAT family N-acetyltransferase n=1 Tax=Herpetosiphon llansteffanensis TaxID=2094568 RepID=UPI000D7CB8AA|nr:GNAT family N-acetyltransferase [Herpetosiphon llansteffanensis]